VVAADAGIREEGAFLSGFVASGSFAAGGWAAAAGSFTAGASVFGARVGASVFGARAGASAFGARAGASVFGATAGASAFGALGALGFISAGAFLSGFLPGSSGVGCWAITAPASASEQTINKLVIFFMLSLFGRRTEPIYSILRLFLLRIEDHRLA
jgi:hypothetical protein